MFTQNLNRFSPLPLNSRISLQNRVVLSPMASQTAKPDGFVSAKTLEHYARLAQAKTGLMMVEYTYVHESGRSESHQLGISTDEHGAGLAQIANLIHESGAVAGLQLTHAGGKSTYELTGGQLMGPSGRVVPVKDQVLETPSIMQAADIELWKKSFLEGARRAVVAGFDLVELHAAHGYGLNQWLSPLTNERTDDYGGSLKNRARLILEIITEIRAQFPQLILAARVPGQDLLPGGLTTSDMIQVSQWLEAAGLDLLDVSSGLGGWRRPQERSGEGYLVPEAALLQTQVSIPVIGVGGIHSGEYIDQLISTRTISLAAVGRAILQDPYLFSLQTMQ
jgi:NADPH2 dehydrogenase